jgi:ABC-type molybdate transport system ATPase subunit
MKTFENQQTSITAPVQGTNEVKEMTYANLAQLILNVPPQGGWTKDEMRIRIKIEDKLEKLKAGEKIELEDAEMQKIVDCSDQPWQFKHKDLLRYLDNLADWNKE